MHHMSHALASPLGTQSTASCCCSSTQEIGDMHKASPSVTASASADVLELPERWPHAPPDARVASLHFHIGVAFAFACHRPSLASTRWKPQREQCEAVRSPPAANRISSTPKNLLPTIRAAGPRTRCQAVESYRLCLHEPETLLPGSSRRAGADHHATRKTSAKRPQRNQTVLSASRGMELGTTLRADPVAGADRQAALVLALSPMRHVETPSDPIFQLATSPSICTL
jgi:hypothetical protein